MKTAFIYKNKCHPVTQTFANSIEADSYKITGPLNAIKTALTIPSYNYYFIESAMSMLVPITKRIIGKKCKIIYRGNDGLFGEKTTAYLKTKNQIKCAFLKYLIKHMDAVSVESEKQISEVKQYTSVPVIVCESYINNKSQLEKIKPNLKTNNFLFIGEYRPPYDHKNIKFLIKLFNNLPDLNLTIIGKNTKQLKENSNITILDYVPSTEEYFKKSTFYIHLPKYEAGPITLLEAITAGLIPITNKNAGHYNVIEKVNKKLIIKKAPIIEIIEITKISLKERRKLSETFKKIGKNHYSKEEITSKFRETWKIMTREQK